MIYSLFLATLLALAVALAVKVSVGVGAWDGLPVLLSQLTGIKVGSLQLAANLSCLVLQLLILRSAFSARYLLQIPLSLVLGYMVNVFYYSIFESWQITSYGFRLVGFILAMGIAAFVVASVMLVDVVSFPLEGACMAWSKKSGRKFHHIRQAADLACILICLVLSFSLNLPSVIREGTVIGMLIFSPLMGWFMRVLKPIYRRYGLTGAP